MLNLEHIQLAYQQQQVITDLSLQLVAGEIGCLLGPSGCGKTSVLRAIAGFVPVQQGRICLRGQQVSSAQQHQAPEKRNVAVVFQDFALFPHLTVQQNLLFSIRHLAKQTQQQRLAELVALVGLQGLLMRYPHALSGGQQQRVALARALAAEPDLLLLDEPFSSLDAELRYSLANDIRKIVKQSGTTALMVTHDQSEAFAIADQIGVMRDGTLEQWGTAYQLYHQPATPFVADFIGLGVFLDAQVHETGRFFTCLGEFSLPGTSQYPPDTPLKLLVRPDDIIYDKTSSRKAKVVGRAFQGAHILYQLALDDVMQTPLLCLAPSHYDHAIGDEFGIRLDLAHKILFAATGNSVGINQ